MDNLHNDNRESAVESDASDISLGFSFMIRACQFICVHM